MTTKTTPFNALKTRLLADPAVKAAYDALESEYEALLLDTLAKPTDAPQEAPERP